MKLTNNKTEIIKAYLDYHVKKEKHYDNHGALGFKPMDSNLSANITRNGLWKICKLELTK